MWEYWFAAGGPGDAAVLSDPRDEVTFVHQGVVVTATIVEAEVNTALANDLRRLEVEANDAFHGDRDHALMMVAAWVPARGERQEGVATPAVVVTCSP